MPNLLAGVTIPDGPARFRICESTVANSLIKKRCVQKLLFTFTSVGVSISTKYPLFSYHTLDVFC